MPRHLAALVFAFVVCGCSAEPLTQVMLVVGTDYAVPTEVSQFSVVASGPNMQIQTAGAMLTSPADLPQTLGLVHEGGELGPVDVSVSAMMADTAVVERRLSFNFQQGRTLELRIDLLQSCAGVSCGVTETCQDGTCRPVDVDPSELTAWTGQPSPADSGISPDAGDAGDAGTPGDAGDGAIDGAPGDAGPDSCEALYGALRRYEECDSNPSECEFYSDPETNQSCDSLCAAGSGVCIEAFRKAGGMESCRRGDALRCDEPDNRPICVCSR